jgi:NAD(P)H-flavin reductase
MAAAADSIGSEPLLPRPHRVRTTVRETHDTFTLTLEAAGCRFLPGQFNMLYAFAVGEVPISVSGDPTREGVLVHTIRDVGPVTAALCHAEPGMIVGVRGPFGTSWPLERAAGGDVVIVAGGIGLAPVRPAIYQMLAQRRAFGRVVVLVGARTPEDLLFVRELESWRSSLDVGFTVDHADPGYGGQVGVVTKLIREARFEAPEAHAFVCGPEIMMRYAVEELLARDVPAHNLFVSMERNMKCAVGFCGHCQLGPELLCTMGPVYSYPRIARLWTIREL